MSRVLSIPRALHSVRPTSCVPHVPHAKHPACLTSYAPDVLCALRPARLSYTLPMVELFGSTKSRVTNLPSVSMTLNMSQHVQLPHPQNSLTHELMT